MRTKAKAKSEHLQELIHRRDKVLAVLHPPTAAHARIMEKAGCEALFVAVRLGSRMPVRDRFHCRRSQYEYSV